MKKRILIISTITFLAAAIVASLFLFTRPNGEPYAKAYLALSNPSVAIKMDVSTMLASGGQRVYEADVIVTAKKMPGGLHFCGTFPEVTFAGRYPAPCSVELGLSSSVQKKQPRPSFVLIRYY